MREHAGPPVPLGLVSVSGARHRMTSIIVTLSIVLAVLVAAIVALLALLWRRVGADRALRKSEAFFRHLADDAPMVMWTTRPNMTFDYLNKFSVEFTGMPLKDLLDEGWLNAVHPDDRDRIQRIYAPAIEARQPVLMDTASDALTASTDGSWTPAFRNTKRMAATRIRRLQFRYHRAQGCGGSAPGESSRSSPPGWPTDRGAGCRKGADRAGPARRRQSATGWVSIAFSGFKQRLGEYHVSNELQQELVALQQQTLKLARNVRQLSHDRHPTVLQHLGLVKGLTWYCGELGRAHGVATTCTAEGDFAAMTPDAALCVYRVAQEALRNVIAHAGASRANVRLVQMGDQAEITIADDGRGFDVTNRGERGHGLGLVSMSERARILGGTVSIVSAPNQGTRVQAKIPMNSEVRVGLGSGMEGQIA